MVQIIKAVVVFLCMYVWAR